MPREIALLTNPSAGRGRGNRTAAIAMPRLSEAGFSIRNLVGRDGDEARDLAQQAVADGVDSLVVVGGDGMVHLAAQVLVESQQLGGPGTRLGIIPAGTGNDVARYLDIPRSEPQLATDVVVRGRSRRIDVARTGATYFVTVLAAGFDALVNERANRMRWPRGQMRYNLATLAELGSLAPRRYTLDLDGDVRELDAVVVAVGNGPSFGGGLKITHGASIDDGMLDVVVMRPISRRELVRTYPRLFNGTHTEHPAYEHHLVRSVTVAAPGIVAYADGERVGPLPLTVEVVPHALEVLVP